MGRKVFLQISQLLSSLRHISVGLIQRGHSILVPGVILALPEVPFFLQAIYIGRRLGIGLGSLWGFGS